MSAMYRYDQAFTDAMDELRDETHDDDAMQPGWYVNPHDEEQCQSCVTCGYAPWACQCFRMDDLDELRALMMEGL